MTLSQLVALGENIKSRQKLESDLKNPERLQRLESALREDINNTLGGDVSKSKIVFDYLDENGFMRQASGVPCEVNNGELTIDSYKDLSSAPLSGPYERKRTISLSKIYGYKRMKA